MGNKRLKILNVILAIILILSVLMPTVGAASATQTGSLTITKKQVLDGVQSLLAGVTFDIYKIGDDEESTEIPAGATALASKTTGQDGVVKFSDLELGRYLVVESDAPENVVSRIDNFIVDIPMTSSDGTSLIYDVEVIPKNNIVYGGLVLSKQDTKGNALAGVTFELQKLNGTTWESYKTDLVTGSEGTLEVEGLPVGSYRFVETATLDGYILDNKTTYPFEVSLVDGMTTVTPSSITTVNEKPEVEKEITTTLTDGSAKIGESILYKITADVPSSIADLKTYEIVDTMSEGLTYTATSLVVKGVKDDTSTTLTSGGVYTANYDETTRELTITFANNSDLAEYDTLEITYNAVLNENAVATESGNGNSVALIYSTVVSTNYNGEENGDTTYTTTDEQKVYTAGFWILKTDTSGNALSGAEFKIASSEANAKAGTYLKDADGNEITLTTGPDGQASYKGLEIGTYYLVETKAPTYDDNGTTKSYNLLTDPVTISIDASTYTAKLATAEIENKKGFDLPQTGGIGAIGITLIGMAIIAIGVVVVKNSEN